MHYNKAVYHYGADYEQELIALMIAVGHQINSAEASASFVQSFLVSKYGEENLNVLELDAQVVNPVDHHVDKRDAEPYLMYVNLYTYVLLKGICIPYYNWVYGFEYHDFLLSRTYQYHNNRCVVKEIERPMSDKTMTLVAQFKQKISIMDGHIKLLDTQLEKLRPLREKSEAIGSIIGSLQAPMQTVLGQLKAKNKVAVDSVTMYNNFTDVAGIDLTIDGDYIQQLIDTAKRVEAAGEGKYIDYGDGK